MFPAVPQFCFCFCFSVYCCVFCVQVWLDDEHIWRPPRGGAHGWGKGDHQQRTGSCGHDGDHGAGEDWVRRKTIVSVAPYHISQPWMQMFTELNDFFFGVKQVPNLCLCLHFFFFFLHVFSGVSPVAWIISRGQRVVTGSHAVCFVGRPLEHRGSQLSSVCNAKRWVDVWLFLLEYGKKADSTQACNSPLLCMDRISVYYIFYSIL